LPWWCDRDRSLAPKGSVVTGSCRYDRGLPTASPASSIDPFLTGSTGEGFAVMSGDFARDRSRAGQFDLPDKEFRYLRHVCYPVMTGCHDVARSFLPGSPCRQRGRTISSRSSAYFSFGPSVQSLRIPLSRFPADCPHRTDCHCQIAMQSDEYRRILGCSSIQPGLKTASVKLTVIVHVGPHVAMRRGPYLHPSA
jgi:hypothetical protein